MFRCWIGESNYKEKKWNFSLNISSTLWRNFTQPPPPIIPTWIFNLPQYQNVPLVCVLGWRGVPFPLARHTLQAVMKVNKFNLMIRMAMMTILNFIIKLWFLSDKPNCHAHWVWLDWVFILNWWPSFISNQVIMLKIYYIHT